MRPILLIALTLVAVPSFAQSSAPWKMPGTKKANPPKVLEPTEPPKPTTINPISWTFPRPGLTSVSISGESYYQLAPEVFARRRNLGDGKDVETAVIMFTPEAIAAAKLLQIQEPDVIPDMNRFVAAMAVLLAVEKPVDYKNEFIGTGLLFEMQFYFFQTKSGIVGASVSADRLLVLSVPSPLIH